MHAILNGILDWVLGTMQDPKIGNEYKKALNDLAETLRVVIKFH